MSFRPFNFLLLAALAYWTSGAAVFVHERMEHADGDEGPEVVQADASHPDKHRDHHNHDDCPTCQLLAHMSADRSAPPALVCIHLPSFTFVHVTDRRPPTVNSRPFAPIRGPPSLVEISI